jgi:hypothetical protein
MTVTVTVTALTQTTYLGSHLDETLAIFNNDSIATLMFGRADISTPTAGHCPF